MSLQADALVILAPAGLRSPGFFIMIAWRFFASEVALPATLIFVEPVPAIRALPPIDVPLFDPPYICPHDTNWSFGAGPWPSFCNGMTASGSFPNYQDILFKDDIVLTPFSLARAVAGAVSFSAAPGTAIGSSPFFYGNQQIDLGLDGVYKSVNSILVPAGLSTVDLSQPLDTLFLAGGGNPVVESPLCGFWKGSGLNVGWMGNDNNFYLMPFIGGTFIQVAPAWTQPVGNPVYLAGTFMLQRFLNNGGKTPSLVQSNAQINGTLNHLLMLVIDPILTPAAYVGVSMLFDNPVLNGAFSPAWAMTEYGLLASWTGAPALIPGQTSQHMLVTGTYNADSPIGQPALENLFYAPLRLNARTETAGAAIGFGAIDVKIDPNGIFYFHPGASFSPPSWPGGGGSYVGNSQGLDISIPGVPIMPSPGLPFSSFCPCSPIAVPIGS